jgi:hypothetical protein
LCRCVVVCCVVLWYLSCLVHSKSMDEATRFCTMTRTTSRACTSIVMSAPSNVRCPRVRFDLRTQEQGHVSGEENGDT